MLPDLKLPPETVEALCEAYGFKPRALVQAASRLALGGELTPEAVRAQAGPGECSPREIEDLLINRDGRALALLLARLSTGAALVDWQGEALDPGETGAFLVRMLGRLLRQAPRAALPGRGGRSPHRAGPHAVPGQALVPEDVQALDPAPPAARHRGRRVLAARHRHSLAAPPAISPGRALHLRRAARRPGGARQGRRRA
ncbi:MAG: hypothetical protein AB2L07_17855 [Thermoanaerobaculaceae bacterium]